uniref:Glutaredoxin domain-containing protein n=1 Tax=Rhabditophanes sp. KR3021 TaxID=114890 RepID=A0AC35UCN6_9BILA
MGSSSSTQQDSANKFVDQIKSEIKRDPVVIYSTTKCGYCIKAKSVLEEQEIPYTEHDLTVYRATKPDTFRDYVATLTDMTKQRTVPQIFICGRFIGGFDDLNALNQRNALLPLIAQCSKGVADSIASKRGNSKL